MTARYAPGEPSSLETNEVSKSIPAVGRVEALDWEQIGDELNMHGCALLEEVLTPEECEALVRLYPANRHSAAGS